MERLTIQHIRGVKDLTQETIDALVSAIEEAHQDIARLPYAMLAQIEAIAAPVHAIEHVQQGVTASVYQAIRAINQLVGTAATQLIDRLEAR